MKEPKILPLVLDRTDHSKAKQRQKEAEEKLSKINSLTEKIENKFGGDPNSFPILAAHPEKMLTFSIVIHCADVGSALYELSVNHLASYNIIIAGIEVYLIRAQTGKLPEKLPEGVPKDPYTGNNFKYEITEDGFKLSLPDKDLQKKKFRLHEFKVKK